VTRHFADSLGLQTLDDRRNVVNPSDELFFALEGRTVESGGDTWRIEVCGVHSVVSADAGNHDHWIQLNLCGPVECELTLRSACLDAAYVMSVVRDWLDDTVSSELEACLVGQCYAPAVRR
jgi:hypothetical protein